MSAIYSWVMDEKDELEGWQRAVGPTVYLLGMAVCVGFIWSTGNVIGDVSCRYRLSYSPRNGAFGIWGVIFPWHFASIFFQFLANIAPNTFYASKIETNVMIGIAWAASGVWTFFFTTSDNPNPAAGLGFAAFFLLVAAVSAFSAVFLEGGFQPGAGVAQILTCSVPFSILAAWLMVAASISVGVFVKSVNISSSESPPTCERDPVNTNEPLIPETESWVDLLLPAFLAVAISAVAISQCDFVISLPVLWAIFFMKQDIVKQISMGVLVASTIAAVVRFVVTR